MKIVSAVTLLSLVSSTNGLVFPKKNLKAKLLYRKSFLVGAAGAAVVAGTATAAGAAVLVNNQVNNGSR